MAKVSITLTRVRLMRKKCRRNEKAESEAADEDGLVSKFGIEVKKETAVLSDDCPECSAPLSRVFLEDLAQGDGEKKWIRRFVDASSDLGPGRYRCSNCLSEWWQFPASVAS
jgi:hypothetical protein